MKAHVIENGAVINTILVDSLSEMPNLIEATEGSIGWLYVDDALIDPNAETEEDRNARIAASNRSRRDTLLAETDWIVIMHTEKGTNIPAAWEIYRQSLRDITAQPGFPHNVTWPTKPE